MELKEYKQTIEDLEPKVERLKALYQQYFMGIEKIPPHVLKKDVERTIWRLRRTRLQNTQAKFKFQQIIQRYNTYSQYWSRILREIEKGTYRRDIVKAAKRFGKDAATAAAGRQAETALRDVEEEEEQQQPGEQVWDLSAGIDSYADDAPTPVPARRAGFSEPAADSTGYYDPREWAPHSQPPQPSGDGYAASSYGGAAEGYNATSPQQGYPAPPRAYPGRGANQGYAQQGQSYAQQGQGYAQQGQGYAQQGQGYAQQGQGYAQQGQGYAPQGQGYAQPGSHQANHAQANDPGHPPAHHPNHHSADQGRYGQRASRDYPPPPDREHYAPRDRTTISQPPPPPVHHAAPAVHTIPEPRATSPGFGPSASPSPAPARPAKPVPPPVPPRRNLGPPPAPRRPLGPPPGSTARAAAPPKPAPPTPPAQPMPATPTSPRRPAPKPATPSSSDLFGGRKRGKPAPGRAAAAPKDDKRQLYDKYIQAKKRAGEDVSRLSYDKVRKSLDKQAQKLKKQHGKNRKVDFEVVEKDGKALIRPVVK